VTTTTITDWKELAIRECDGLVVSLSWSRTADQIQVAVADEKLDEEFHLNVPGACALDAFYHPFAYASGRSLVCCDAIRVSLDLQPQN
jgi:hypothetical protein